MRAARRRAAKPAGIAIRLLKLARARLRSVRRWSIRAALDARDRLTGRRDPLVPPRRLGMPSQLRAVGARTVEHALIDAAALRPGDRLLDVGCGPGRLAASLVSYLDPAAGGRYEGFDVMPAAIEWCRGQITPRHPHFRFQLAEVRNGEYSPGAEGRAEEYHFPYPGETFDVTVAASLYTHMLPFQTAHYLRETARVLAPGGRSAASFFLLNEDSESRLDRGVELAELVSRGRLDFGADLDDGRGGRYRTTDPRQPERRIALHESDVRAMYEAAGLRIAEIRFGHWCGRERAAGRLGQDWVIARP